MMTLTRFAGAAIGTLLFAAPALAAAETVTFAQFTQQSQAKVAQYANTGAGNTLTVNSAPAFFVVTDFGPNGVYPANLTMSASSSAQVTNLGLQFEQTGWNGNMQFTNGQNWLTVNFVNATFSFDGTGGSASLISTDPNNPISFTSSFLDLPDFTFKNFAIAFSGLTPAFSVGNNGFGNGFTANVAGSFAGSADAGPAGIPEPTMWAMMLAGFGFTGVALRRRKPERMIVLS
jgi:hypothetical protein